MSKSILARYIRMILETTRDARVPNQLIDDEDSEKGEENETSDVREFSGVGAIAGYTAPLGKNPNDLGRVKNRSKNNK